MKKTISIILSMAMLFSMYTFAVPSGVVQTESSQETEEADEAANVIVKPAGGGHSIKSLLTPYTGL